MEKGENSREDDFPVDHDFYYLFQSERCFIFVSTVFVVLFKTFEEECLLIWCEESGVFWEWDDEEECEYAEEDR